MPTRDADPEGPDLGIEFRMSGKAYIRRRPLRLIRWPKIKETADPCSIVFIFISLRDICNFFYISDKMTAGLKNVVVVGGSFVGLVS
jgi:hypothetical protein